MVIFYNVREDEHKNKLSDKTTCLPYCKLICTLHLLLSTWKLALNAGLSESINERYFNLNIVLYQNFHVLTQITPFWLYSFSMKPLKMFYLAATTEKVKQICEILHINKGNNTCLTQLFTFSLWIINASVYLGLFWKWSQLIHNWKGW